MSTLKLAATKTRRELLFHSPVIDIELKEYLSSDEYQRHSSDENIQFLESLQFELKQFFYYGNVPVGKRKAVVDIIRKEISHLIFPGTILEAYLYSDNYRKLDIDEQTMFLYHLRGLIRLALNNKEMDCDTFAYFEELISNQLIIAFHKHLDENPELSSDNSHVFKEAIKTESYRYLFVESLLHKKFRSHEHQSLSIEGKIAHLNDALMYLHQYYQNNGMKMTRPTSSETL